MSIRVVDLTKTYGEQAAVDHLSFEVKKGQICGFLGPNGAGKTTTMKMLSCFTTPSAGKAFVADFDVEKNPFDVRRRLGYLPEHNPLYKNMYVREYLHFVAQLHKLKGIRARVDEMIEVTGLTLEQNKPIRALSKGYRQRVGLAQAMIHDPEVLILDEPTSGLDPNQLADIRQLIQHLGQDKTVLFSSHIMQEIEAICDRIIIIDRGKLIADESKDVLKQRALGQLQIEVTFESDVPYPALVNLEGIKRVDKKTGRTFTLWADESSHAQREVFLFAAQQGHIILEMKKSDVSVESIFQQLTGKQ